MTREIVAFRQIPNALGSITLNISGGNCKITINNTQEKFEIVKLKSGQKRKRL